MSVATTGGQTKPTSGSASARTMRSFRSLRVEALLVPVSASNTAGGCPSVEISWTPSPGIVTSVPPLDEILILFGALSMDESTRRSSRRTSCLESSTSAPALRNMSLTEALSILTPTSDRMCRDASCILSMSSLDSRLILASVMSAPIPILA